MFSGRTLVDETDALQVRLIIAIMKQPTKKERKIIVYIATSADGYIARPDGSVDWLNYPHTVGDYGMGAFYRSIDTILWGRKTIDVALGFQKKGVKGSAFDTKIKNYAFSHKRRRNPPPGVEFVSEPIATFAKGLRAFSQSQTDYRRPRRVTAGPLNFFLPDQSKNVFQISCKYVVHGLTSAVTED